MNQITLTSEPTISVGIMRSVSINAVLFGEFILENVQQGIRGPIHIQIQNGQLVCSSDENEIFRASELIFSPRNATDDYFQLRDVIIGIQFHWERKEKQSFRGQMKLIMVESQIQVINIIPIEEYLCSVISSEMSSKCSQALLQAHAVISRSWLLAQIQKSQTLKSAEEKYEREIQRPDEIIRWYDREDHTLFDVCADDHCQRYQGITKLHSRSAQTAVGDTRGLVLMWEEAIGDARFSKSCGGTSEAFENVWEETHYPYLSSIVDYQHLPDHFHLDLTNESNAVEWIKGSPPAFCNTTDKKILEQVLLEYDQETKDFFRWQVIYSQSEISEMLLRRTGIDFGNIVDLIPVQRGASARIIKLKICGTNKTLTIGKELEIRKSLSSTHLYSSAFIVEKEFSTDDTLPSKFILTGAGWGHGVGLCQIGAAVMAEQGYAFDEILQHYYVNADIKKIY